VTTSEPLPEWRDYLAILGEADGLLQSLADPEDPLARQEVYRLLFLALASGFQSAFMDPDLPDFTPMVGNVLNGLGTNPDFIYAGTLLDGTGQYRLFGERGDGLFLLIDFVAGGLYVTEERGASTGVLDIDSCTRLDGSFDVLLSRERPAAYQGDWFPLDPRTRVAMVRQAAYDWGSGREARIAIERVDRPLAPRRPDAAEVARRLELLAAFPARFGAFALYYGAGQRARGVVNRLEHDDWAGRGGVAGQHYFQGIFRLAPGEAMILETELPERVRYWNVQLNDPLWNAIDWINRQSSLNGGQAVIDADGKFRAVIALEDPGVPNWLDPGGYAEGSLMLRWLQASSAPEPVLKLVPAEAVRRHLPSQTPVVCREMRDQTLRARRRSAQLRRRW